MDKLKALETLAKHNPHMGLNAALALVNDLLALSEETTVLTPKQWAEAVFSWNDKNTRKIGMIKEIRHRFNLGLKESKDIADECIPRASVDFFPPRHDGYGF